MKITLSSVGRIVAVAFLALCAAASGRPAGGAAGASDSAAEHRRLHTAHGLGTWQNVEDTAQLRFGLLRSAEIVPTAVISRQGPVRVLPQAPMPEVGRISVDSPLGKTTLDDFVERSNTDAFMVVRQGKVVYERYLHMRPYDQHLYWSISKTMVSVLVGMLEDEGRVDVSQPIERYIAALASSAWKGTRVIDLLDMASGMACLENDDPNPLHPESPYYWFEATLGLLPRTAKTVGTTYEYLASLKRLKPPGTVREYMSVNSVVLGWLVEEVTGKAYAEVLRERIWAKIGAESDAAIFVSADSGAASSHGGVISTLRDLARYGLIFTPSWKVVSEQPVVSKAYMKKVRTAARPELFHNRTRYYPEEKPFAGDYVSTWHWDRIWPDRDMYKAGYQGQGLYVSPSRDLVLAGFSSGKPYATGAYYRDLALAMP